MQQNFSNSQGVQSRLSEGIEKMGIKKSTGLFAIVIIILAATSIGLLIALLLARLEPTNPNSSNNNESSESVVGSPTISKDWEEQEKDQVTEKLNETPAPTEPPITDDKKDEEEKPVDPWEKDVRLPKSVVPVHYDLYLFPDLQEGIFVGNVELLIESHEPRDHFLIHAKDLHIENAVMFQVSGSQKSPVQLSRVFKSNKNEFLVFVATEVLPPANYTIAINFRGNLTRGIVGFYKSVYTNSRGEKIPIATSKFQPTYARRAFPCMDEPSFKSTFSVTLVRPQVGYVALSNMPVQKETQNSPAVGFTEVKFEKSVPMVTYLACFIVCDFEYEEKRTEIHQTLFRVYATPNQRDRVRYALEVGANITDYFEDFFEIPYPLPKQDMIAIPDFVSGAMEHWGLITYRETNLLYDPRESSSSNQQRVAIVISHELAHQWFGNLVTLSWWDDLWLNEGFASFMEYKGVANFHPDWDMESQFITTDLHKVLDLDSTINSHPIIQTVDHPDQITEIFDAISYSKGASVLRMLESFMGGEEFRLGIKRFLEKYKYGNAITNDLWKELEGVSSKGLNITRIMDTWTRQMGYPIVNVERVKFNMIRLRQERYLMNPELGNLSAPSPYCYKWDIPITYITNNEQNAITLNWLHTTDPFIELTFPSGTDWVKFNVGQYGYYRVNYPKDEWLAFATLLLENHEILSTTDRGSLINDAFSLAESGHLDYSIPMSMTLYLKKENDLVPWMSSIDKIKFLETMLDKSEQYGRFRKYIVDLIDGHYKRLGWRDDGSHTDRLNRIDMLFLACRNGHPECLSEAGDLFLAWIKDKSAYIPPNLRNIVYRFGMVTKGDENSWSIMFERFRNEENAQEKRKLLFGLSWINQPWMLEQFLRLAKNESIVRGQDFFTCLNYISQNPIGNPIVWRFIREEWPYLVTRFTLNDRYLGRLPKDISADYSSKFQLEELKDFFAKFPEAGAGARARKQAIESIENNIEWLNKHQQTIELWLKNNVQI